MQTVLVGAFAGSIACASRCHADSPLATEPGPFHSGGPSCLSTSGMVGIGAKGAAKREKLQAALAARSGDFFLQVMQAAFKRLNPSAPCPGTLEDLSGQVSICHYLESLGGFGGHRETGYIMWCLAHVADGSTGHRWSTGVSCSDSCGPGSECDRPQLGLCVDFDVSHLCLRWPGPLVRSSI